MRAAVYAVLMLAAAIATGASAADITFLAHFDQFQNFNADYATGDPAFTVVGSEPVSVGGYPGFGPGNLAVQIDRLGSYLTYAGLGNVVPTDGLSIGFWMKQSFDTTSGDVIDYRFASIERVGSPSSGSSLSAEYGTGSSWFSFVRGYHDSLFFSQRSDGWHHLAADAWYYYNVDLKFSDNTQPGHLRLLVYDAAGNLLQGVGGPVAATLTLNPGQYSGFDLAEDLAVVLGGGPAYSNPALTQTQVVIDEFAIWNGSLARQDVDAIVASMVAGHELAPPAKPDPFPDGRPQGYGRRWVREHPFNIFSWGAGDVHDPLFQQLNLTGIEARGFLQAFEAAQQDVIWNAYLEELYDGPPLTVEIQNKINLFAVYGGPRGAIHLADEPPIEAMDNLGVIAQWVRQAHPQMMIFVTAGWGPTDEYIDTLMTTIRPDVLMYDIYPVLNGQAFDLDYHFEYLMRVRRKAAQYGVPCYAWLQSFADSERRLPSESELRMLAYSYLAAGYKGLGYYKYAAASSGNFSNALLDLDDQPSPLFYHAANLNPEIQNLGQALRFLRSVDVRFIPGQHLLFGSIRVSNPTPSGLSNWAIGAGSDPHIIAASVQEGNDGLQKNGLIGFFVDDEGQRYFMLVNLNQGADLSAADAALTFVVTFDDAVNSIWLLNRATGLVEEIVLADHTLTWTLPGGTGDLFKYGDGNFPGLAIPEPGSAAALLPSSVALLSVRRRNAAHCLGTANPLRGSCS